MKKIYTLLFACITFISAHATSYTISIVGSAYSPNTLTVSIGDVITIQAMAAHPTAQVDLATWNADGTATLSTGWGVVTSDFTFTITSTNSIYYVCQNHVASGMKGQITVTSTGIKEQVKAVEELAIFPIPASQKININYTLNETSFVNVDVIGINGQHVTNMITELQTAGVQQRSINVPSGLATGVYLLKITVNGNVSEQRLISIR